MRPEHRPAGMPAGALLPETDTEETRRLPPAPTLPPRGKSAGLRRRQTQKGLRVPQKPPRRHLVPVRRPFLGPALPGRAPRAGSGPALLYPVLQLSRELALELAPRPAAVVALDEHLARHGRLLRPHRAAAARGPAAAHSSPLRRPPPLTYGCRKSVVTAPGWGKGGSGSAQAQRGRDAEGQGPARACAPAGLPLAAPRLLPPTAGAVNPTRAPRGTAHVTTPRTRGTGGAAARGDGGDRGGPGGPLPGPPQPPAGPPARSLRPAAGPASGRAGPAVSPRGCRPAGRGGPGSLRRPRCEFRHVSLGIGAGGVCSHRLGSFSGHLPLTRNLWPWQPCFHKAKNRLV